MIRRLPFLLLLLAASCAGAQAPWGAGESRGEDLVVKLVTIDPSKPIYTWWGHSGLIVEDLRLRQARFYNYGLFSFEAEHFALDYAGGRLWFQVGATSAARELEYEKSYDRGIRIQTLDLPPAARLELGRALEHDILPENRVYLYEHYTDNCATRIRDQIDRAAGGRLAAVGAAAGRMTLREHTRRHTSRSFLIDWLLMFLMSTVIDSPTSRWEEMFLPGELERDVRLVRLPDGRGGERPLVIAETTFHTARRPYPVPERPPAHWPWGLSVGAALGAAGVALGLGMRRGGGRARSLFGSYSALLGFVFGSLGTVLFLMAAFTDHTVTYGNENLFLANPLTLAALPLGLIVLLRRPVRRAGRPPGSGPAACRTACWLARLWCLLAGVAALYLLVKLAGLVLGLRVYEQRNELAVATIVPVLAGQAAASLLGRLGCFSRAGRPARTARSAPDCPP